MPAPKQRGVYVRQLQDWVRDSLFWGTDFSPSGAGFSSAIYFNNDNRGREMWVFTTFAWPFSSTGINVSATKGEVGVFCANAQPLRFGDPAPPVHCNTLNSNPVPGTLIATVAGGTVGTWSPMGQPMFIVPAGWSMIMSAGATAVAMVSSILFALI